MSFTLDGCRAVITGASSGLGVEFARQLASRASALCLVARRQAELEKTKALVLEINPKVLVELCVADISSEHGRTTIVEAAKRLPGGPNLLVNNAGLGDYGLFESSEATKTQALIEVNVTGLVMLTHGMLPFLSAPGGILNVSSLAGTVFIPALAVYAASKSFVTSFSEALRLELAAKGIRVSALCPGPTPTNFSQTARRPDGEDTNRSGQGALRQPNDRVVREGLAALEEGRASCYPGTLVNLAGSLFRMMPRAWMRWAMSRRMSDQ